MTNVQTDSPDIGSALRAVVALTREMILAADDAAVQPVEVPEWGGTVWVRTMTGDERDEFEAGFDSPAPTRRGGAAQQANLRGTRARLVALTACTADGTPLFTTADVAALGRKSAGALQRVFAATMELNGFSPKEVETLAESFPEESK